MTYTPEQYNEMIQKKLRDLNVAEVVVLPAAIDALDSFRQRIFMAGEMADGSKTGGGKYSTEPFYASKKAFKNTGAFKPQGKNAQKNKAGALKKGEKYRKDGIERKSMYLGGGYKELRAIQGMETSFVNMQYTGDLFTDLTKLSIQGDSVVLRVSRKENIDKIKGLEKKYGTQLFRHSDEEVAEFVKKTEKELINYLTGN